MFPPKTPKIPDFDLDSIYDSTEPEPTKEKSWWEWASSAPEMIAKPAHELGQNVSKWIDPERGTSGWRANTSAFAESLADTTANLFSPINLAGNALTGGGYMALKAGLPTAAKAMGATGAALNVPDMVQGTQQVFKGEHLDEQLQGLASVVFGGMGVKEGVDVGWNGYGNKPKPEIKSSDPTIPDSLMGTNTYAGPERRNMDTRPKVDAANVAFQEYRDRLAKGEDVRSPQSLELFKKKQDLDNSRESAAETYTQEKPEIGDIIVDKTGNDHEFVGYNERGKEVWKLTGKQTGPEVDLDAQYDAIVDELPTNEPARLPRDPFNAEALRQQTADDYLPSSMSKGPGKIDPNSFELLDPDQGFGNNASGDSMASAEANSRNRGMVARGEKFVVYDRAGNRRELIGPEAVDFVPQKGQTYGIEYNDGRFSPLNHQGGKVPTQDFRTQLKDTLATTKKVGQDIPGWEPSRAIGQTQDSIGMGMTKDPVQMMKSYLNTYAEAGGRVATKELIQNAIDAAEDTLGEVDVKLDHDGKSVVVTDTGPGLTRHMIQNEYTNLTESGKRGGPNKKIGEMGVGKTTYLLGSENFHVKTLAREPDGKLWVHEFSGTPEDMYNGTTKLDSKISPDQSLPTGTQVKIGMKDSDQVEASDRYLRQFHRYSNTPVKVNVESLKYATFYDPATKKAKPGYEGQHQRNNLIETLEPRTFGGGKDVHSGTLPGGDYRLSIPPGTNYGERNQIALILMNRGMFQGVDSMHVSKGDLPEAILVEIDPTVDALQKEYPLTAPTRERLKDSFKTPLYDVVNKEIVAKAAEARKQRIQDAYDSLVPQPWGGHVTLDSGGKYTPDELAAFNDNPHILKIADTFQQVLGELSGLFPKGSSGGQQGRTAKYGFHLGDENQGGINIPNPGAKWDAKEYAVLINPFSALASRDPQQAARKMFHIMKHEFTHNIVRSEGADFTWALSETDSKFPIRSEIDAYHKILEALTDETGNYAPAVQELLQRHTEARGRPDTIPDLLSETRSSEWAKGPGAGGISGSPQSNGAGVSPINATGGRTTPPISAPQVQAAMKQLYQLQAVHKMAPNKVIKESLYAKIRDFNKSVLTSMDVSGAGRQGLPLIAEKEYWTSLDDMFKSLGSKDFYQALRDSVDTSPLAQKRYAYVVDANGNNIKSRQTGQYKVKELPSFYEEWGLDLAAREESIGSKWADKIPGVAASQRAYSGFLTKLRFDTFNRMMQDLANTGIDIKQDVNAGKKLAEFINNATGRGSLGKLESTSVIWNNLFFAPKLIASKINRITEAGKLLNPTVYRNTPPQLRQNMLKSLLSTAAFGLAMGEMAKFAGAQVNDDPTSSDFRKIRIGKTRIDPFGGDQQYVVAAMRLLSGRNTSPNATRTDRSPRNSKEFFQNAGTVLGRFGRNKLAPIPGFVTSLFTQKNAIGQDFKLQDEIINSTIPIVLQDLAELSKQDPGLLPLGVLPILGIPVDTFERRNNR